MSKALPPIEGSRRTGDEVNRLLALASKGDEEATAALRKALDGDTKLVDGIGNMAVQARQSLITLIAGKNAVVAEAIQRKMSNLWDDLAGPSPSPIEKLLVGRITLCWLQLHYADTHYTQNMETMTLAQADFYQRRISHCHARYLSAIRTLAMVRRMLRPMVAQVNIAEQQVNIAGDGT